MIQQIKNLARHSSVYTFSTFIQRALGFVMLPVYTDIAYISKTAYSDLTLVYTFTAFMTILYLYGMDAALLRYFFLGKESRSTVYKSGFIGVFVNSLLISGLLFLFADSAAYVLLGNAAYALFIKLAAVIMFLDGLGNLPYLILRAEEKSAAYSLFRIGRFLLEVLLNILFVVVLRYGVIGILYANVIAAFVNLLALLPYQQKYLRAAFSKETFLTLIKFGLPMIPNGIAYLTVEMSDKYLMRFLLGKETLALYSANYKFGAMLLLVVIAFRTAWQPFFLKIAKEDENPRRIYARVLTYFTLGGAFVVVAGSYFIEYLIKFPLSPTKTLMGSAYWSGVTIIPVILTAYLFYGLYVNFTVGVYIKKKTRLMVVFTGLAALVNVGSNFYLMPHFGIMGAAVATLLSYITMAAAILIANQRMYPVPYEFGRIAAILGYLAGMLFLLYSFDLTFWVRLLLILISPVLFYFGGFLNKEEIRFLRIIIRK